MRFPIGDDHHHFGGPRSTAAALVEAPLTDGRKQAEVTTSQGVRKQRPRKEGRSEAANRPGVLNGLEGVGGGPVHLRDPGRCFQHVFLVAVLVQFELKLGVDTVLDDADLAGREKAK